MNVRLIWLFVIFTLKSISNKSYNEMSLFSRIKRTHSGFRKIFWKNESFWIWCLFWSSKKKVCWVSLSSRPFLKFYGLTWSLWGVFLKRKKRRINWLFYKRPKFEKSCPQQTIITGSKNFFSVKTLQVNSTFKFAIFD